MLHAVRFVGGGAFGAVALASEAGLALGAEPDPVANFEVLYLGADADGGTDDFVSDAAGVVCWALFILVSYLAEIKGGMWSKGFGVWGDHNIPSRFAGCADLIRRYRSARS